MQAAGIYRNGMDVRFATFSVVSLILGPVSLSSATKAMGFEGCLMGDRRWIEHVAHTLDASLS